MLSRLLHSLLLPGLHHFEQLVVPLLNILVSMEEVVKRLPEEDIAQYYKDWNSGMIYLYTSLICIRFQTLTFLYGYFSLIRYLDANFGVRRR